MQFDQLKRREFITLLGRARRLRLRHGTAHQPRTASVHAVGEGERVHADKRGPNGDEYQNGNHCRNSSCPLGAGRAATKRPVLVSLSRSRVSVCIKLLTAFDFCGLNPLILRFQSGTGTTASPLPVNDGRQAKRKAAKVSAKPRKGALDPAAKFSWDNGKANPFREGSGAYQRVEILRTKYSGQTVEAIRGRNDIKVSTLATVLRLGLGRVG